MNWNFNRNNESKFSKSLYSTSSVFQLGEFKNKLINSKKSLNEISVPSWKVFRNKIKTNASPKKYSNLRLDYYSNIESFRSSSPKKSNSPFRFTRKNSISSAFSNRSSPKSMRSPLISQVIRSEDFQKASQMLLEMNERDLEALPDNYVEQMLEFCKLVKRRIKY